MQLQKEPISLIIEFKGECDTSVTISKLLSCDCDNETIENVKATLTTNDWLIISHDLTEALWHIHSKGFLHCDLKSNSVLVSKKHGYIIDFGKACDSSFQLQKSTLHVILTLFLKFFMGLHVANPAIYFPLEKFSLK